MSVRKNIDKLLKSLEKEYVTQNRIEVSQVALLHNVGLFEHLTDKTVIPVLKGNAYGHGIEVVAEALTQRELPYIAVDGYFEALRIREVSDQPVLIMGAIKTENFERLKYDNFSFVVHDEISIRALGKTGKQAKVHLECNTGMNRYGAHIDELRALTTLIASFKNLELEGVMSHLADSDGRDLATVTAAVKRFDKCVEVILAAGAHPTMLHISQTAGSLRAKSEYANAIRLGIGLYGINPFPRKHALHRGLQHELCPALKFVSTITQVIELNKGDKVSYNYTFTAPSKMKIGVLPVGYYEGVNRVLSNGGLVKIGEAYVPIIGRVCMNHTIISLEGTDAKLGDEVMIYSDNPRDKNAVDAVASSHKLFNYNLLTSISPDVRRILTD